VAYHIKYTTCSCVAAAANNNKRGMPIVDLADFFFRRKLKNSERFPEYGC